MKQTRNSWSWLYRHTCGFASKTLQRDEDIDKPFKPGKRTSVEIKSLTKTHTPNSYQVLWHEVTADKGQTTLKVVDYTGTFTVARIRPKNLTEAMDNRLGLCVNGYNTSPNAKGGF